MAADITLWPEKPVKSSDSIPTPQPMKASFDASVRPAARPIASSQRKALSGARR